MKTFLPPLDYEQPMEHNSNITPPPRIQSRFISYISPKYHETLNRVKKYSSFCRVLKFSRGTSQILSISTCRKLKNIQKCDFEFVKCTDHELVHLSRALSNIKSLQYLTLHLQDCEVNQKNGFFSLFKQLRKLKKTSSVQLKFIWCRISDNELTEFSKALRLQRAMHKLSISFHGREMFTEKGFSNFTSQLSKYNHVRDLELCMDYFQNINEKKVFQLFEALSNITELTNLKIKICHRGVNNACLEYLSNSLKQLTKLEELELAFQSCYKVENIGIEALAFALPNLTAIKSISFDFSWCEKISLQGIRSLVYGLSKLEQLEKLKLDIRGCNKIDDITLSILWAAIANFSLLTSLNLSLGDGKMISTSGFSNLHTQFANLTQLTQLKLMFDVCKFMDDSILASVSKSLSSLENLTDLVLLVHLGGYVSDFGIAEISKIFSSIRKLKSLRLHFYMYKYIGSNGFSSLSQVLSQLEDLEFLTINFSWSNVGSQGIISLGSGIMNMTQIKKLKLSFYSCKDIDDESIKHLIEAIATMKDLELLNLDFGGCKVTHKGIRYIADRLCHFSKLDNLDFNFSSCQGIGDKGVRYICDKVREMKSLVSLNLDFESTGSLPLSKDSLKSITSALPKLEYFSLRASSEGFIL